ncbi:MAG: hypothetical protein NWF01_06665 [Candidatus Bathyarchaeota archaeon]|nr:hypothetical protein [Candidatus Bathyarchaeota archaeon]
MLKYRASEYEDGGFMPEGVLLTNEDRALLVKVSSLLEEVVETFSVLEDKEAMSCLKKAEKDVEAGRVRDYDKFLKELEESDEI